MDERETKEVRPLAALATGFFLAMLAIAPMIILVIYFSDIPDSFGYKAKNESFVFAFSISVLVSFILALIFMARAIRKPKESEND